MFKKKFLVTGGCGFIGSHLVDALAEDGHAVVVLDNLSTGKMSNAHPLSNVIVGDTTDYSTVENAFDGIDGCFHLAAIASVEKSIHEWAKTHTTNVTSTVNVFQAASKLGKVPVVYTSSAAVYGNTKTIPTPEVTTDPPLTAYGVDKLGCDLHGNVASSVHGVPNIGLRPFNVYGPRQDPSSPYSGVISIFVNRVLQDLPITIYGDGEQVRDFVFVGDAVKAFIAAMACLQKSIPRAEHDVINICTGRPTSINFLLEKVFEIAGRTPRCDYGPGRTGDIRISVGDPSRLKARLGLHLQTTLPEGLSSLL